MKKVMNSLSKTRANKIISMLLGIALSTPFLRLSVYSVSIPLFMILTIIYIVINGLNVSINKSLFLVVTIAFISIILSSMLNINHYSINLSEISRMIVNLIFFLIVSGTTGNKEDLNVVIKYSTLGISLVSIYSIYQYIYINDLSYIGIDFEGFGQSGRNSLAILLGFNFLISLFAGYKNRAIKIIMPLFLFISLLLTQSRGVFISVIFSITIYFFINLKYRGISVNRKSLKLILVILIVFLVSGYILNKMDVLSNVIRRMYTIRIFSDKFDDVTSNDARRDLINKAFEIFTKKPIFGIGIGNFPLYKSNLVTSLYITHNDYTKIISEMGVFGLSIFSILVISIFRKSTYLIKSNIDKPFKSFPVVTIYFLVYMLFINAITSPMFWFFAGVLFQTYYLVSKNERVVI